MSRAIKKRPNPKFSRADADMYKQLWHYDSFGYVTRSRKNRKQYAHRMVLSRKLRRPITTTEFADHRDGNLENNTRSNIRLATPEQSGQHKPNSSPFRGTTRTRSGKWQAGVGHKGRFHHIGLFSNRIRAAQAASKKRRELGFFQ